MPTFPRAPGFPPAPGTTNFPPAVPAGGGGLGGGGFGPRSVSFTQKRPGGGMTLDALMARQKDAAARQAEALATPQTTIPGGIGQMITSFTQGLRQSRAEQEEQRGHQVISDVFSHMDPATGATAEQMAAIGEYDPDLMIKLWSDRSSRLNQEKWTPIPTPEGENGQWFQNQQGDTKKVGGGSPGEGTVKLSDIASLRQDVVSDPSYKNMAQAAPIWSSMQDANTRDTPQADLNMVIGLAKLFDPTSVVRTQEGEAIQQTGNLPTQIFSQWKFLTAQPGARLSPEIRQGMMQEGWSRVKGYHDAYAETAKTYTDIATRHGVNPADVVPTFQDFKPYEAAPEGIPRPDNDADLKVGQTYTDDTGQAATYNGKNPANPDDPVNWELVHGAPGGGGV